MTRRIRYNRASIESAIDAARRIVSGTELVRYVYPRAGGFSIEESPDHFNQRGYKVTANGIEKIGDW